MFVEAMPKAPLPQFEEFAQGILPRFEPLEQLRRASPLAAAGADEQGMGVGAEPLEQFALYQRQLQLQLQRAAASTALLDSSLEQPKSPLMQADLAMLTQHIATLKDQLSRFEMQMQRRVTHAARETSSPSLRQPQEASWLAEQSLLAGLRSPGAVPYPFESMAGGHMPFALAELQDRYYSTFLQQA